MDRMLVVVFDTESKAYEGKRALIPLDNEGSISVYASAVIAKNADGATTVRQGDDQGPLGTLVGTSLGSLIGLLGGPVGLAIGAQAFDFLPQTNPSNANYACQLAVQRGFCCDARHR